LNPHPPTYSKGSHWSCEQFRSQGTFCIAVYWCSCFIVLSRTHTKKGNMTGHLYSYSLITDFYSSLLCLDQRWGPPSLLSSGYRRSFPGGKAQLGRDADHSPPSM
jgi:hypothetical protein